MRTTPEPDEVERLRRGLAAMADESGQHPVDLTRIGAGAVTSARRTRGRRRAAAAVGLAVVAALVVIGLAEVGGRGSSAPPAVPGPSKVLSVLPTASTVPTSTVPAVPPSLLVKTQSGTLAVKLTVTSGPGDATAHIYVARWTITWSGGAAPAGLSLLYVGPEIRARSKLAVSCTDRKRSGRLEGQVDVSDPGPHQFTAVVIAYRCDGSEQRSVDVKYWTWTQPR